MYTKILIVSLLQVTLARNVPNVTPSLKTNANSGRQLYLYEPGIENFDVAHQDTRYKTADFNGNHGSETYGRYAVENTDGHEHFDHEHQNNEKETVNNEYGVRNDGGIHQYSEVAVSNDDSSSSNANHFRSRYHINKIRNSAHSMTDSEPDTLKTNLDSSSPNQRPENKFMDDIFSHQQTVEGQVETNENQPELSYIPRLGQPVEATTVPVIFYMPVPLKTNSNFHSRFAETESANDSLVEARNGDSVTFSAIDNPKPQTNASDKTTTDNEVRYNGNQGETEDVWVWSTETTTTTVAPTETVLPDGGLDDRTSFNADGCPQGQAKILGNCVPKH